VLTFYSFSSIVNQTNNLNSSDLCPKCTILILNKGLAPYIGYNLMPLAILFNFLYAQHISDINISIIRSLRLFCSITKLVVLFLVRCVLEFRCGWFGVVSVLQAEACNTDTTPTRSSPAADVSTLKPLCEEPLRAAK